MKNVIIATILSSVVLSGCAATKSTTISAPFSVSVYNSVANKYMPKLTEILLQEKDGKDLLYIGVEKYGSSYGQKEWVSFTKESASKSIPLIDKYLEWESLASKRGDQLDKEIGRVETPSGQFGDVVFSFHSGNQHSHHLNIYGSATTYSHMYTKGDAIKLRGLLTKFISGNLTHLETDSVYN